MENVTVVIRIDAGLINVNPETVEEALNKYFYPDGAVSVFYAAQQSVHLTALQRVWAWEFLGLVTFLSILYLIFGGR